MSIRNFNIHGGVQSTVASFINGTDDIKVMLHKTIVFEKNKKQVTLRNGGWKTVSTKTVINKCFNQLGINAYLYQKKGQWLVLLNDQLDSKAVVPFTDGMKIKL